MTPSCTPSANLLGTQPSVHPRSIATIASAELLTDRKLVHIEHRGELYSLRETRLGKLILTK